MKTTSLIFWQSIVLLFSECFCYSPNPNNMWPERRSASESRPSQKTNDSSVEDRDQLVSELQHLGTDYMRSLKSMENILYDMQDKWQHIDHKSKALKRNMGHLLNNEKSSCNNDKDPEFENEEDDFFAGTKDNQKEAIKMLVTGIKGIWEKFENTSWHVPNEEISALRSQMAGLLFLLKERHCESWTETFYKGRCHPIGRGEHCPHNSLMVLYDGKNNNKGFCDCQDNISGGNGLLPILSNETGICYFQNTQGPCSRGEWFVIKNGMTQCEAVPNRCFADGKHVYGKMNGSDRPTTLSRLNWSKSRSSSTESKCWEIGSSDHCPSGQTVKAEQNSNGDLRVHCSLPVSQMVPSISLAYFTQCRVGTKRNRHGNCHRGFVG